MHASCAELPDFTQSTARRYLSVPATGIDGNWSSTVGATPGGALGHAAAMISAQSKLLYQLNRYVGERVAIRRANSNKTVREVCKIVTDVLKEVEVQEPKSLLVPFENSLLCIG